MDRTLTLGRTFGCLGLIALLTACQDPNKVALQIGGPPDNAAALRAIETRRFDDAEPLKLLGSATAALQDLGYTVTESAPAAGVVVGSKQRDAEEAGEVAGQIALTIAMAALGAAYVPTWDKTQSIHLTLVVSPVGHSRSQDVRVSFDRYITNNHGELWRTELITDPLIYQQFYDRLNQGLALERHT
jgi:hypothetical protein